LTKRNLKKLALVGFIKKKLDSTKLLFVGLLECSSLVVDNDDYM